MRRHAPRASLALEFARVVKFPPTFIVRPQKFTYAQFSFTSRLGRIVLRARARLHSSHTHTTSCALVPADSRFMVTIRAGTERIFLYKERARARVVASLPRTKLTTATILFLLLLVYPGLYMRDRD